ncbi:MAG: tripartite tricarboxylate transporter substrate binding protein [Sciscionella sp.]
MNRNREDELVVPDGTVPAFERRNFLQLAGAAALIGITGATVAGCGSSGSSAGAGGGGAGAKYPTRPVNLIVPYGAGGGSDQLARTVGPFAAKKLGVSIPVENDPGGNGAVGLAKLAGSAPDGYTIGTYIADNTASLAFGNAPWHLNQLTGVCRLMKVPSFYFTNSTSKYKTIQDVIQAAKSKPGSIRIATVGKNSVDEITTRVVEAKSGAKFTLVPFSKPAERYKSLLNGEVEVLYEQGGDVHQYINGGQFRPLVVFSKKTFGQLPKVPTSQSMGWPVYFPQYRGVMAPVGTPSNIRNTLFQAFQAWAKSDSYKKFTKQQYMTSDSFKGPDFFQNEVQSDIKQMKQYIKHYGPQ